MLATQDNYVDLVNLLNQPLGKVNKNQLEWCTSVVVNFNSKDQKNNENIEKILINLCKHSLHTKNWKYLEKSLKQFVFINDNKENIHFCEGLIYSALYVTRTNFNKENNPLLEFKDAQKLVDISFGLDNIVKAANIAANNGWADILYKCSKALWCIIEPWLILHFDFSKLFTYYIYSICNCLEKVDISDYEWKIFLYFKLSKSLYISSTSVKDIKYIRNMSSINYNNLKNSNNNSTTNSNSNINGKNQKNSSKNAQKISQIQNQTQTLNSENSIFVNILILYPELNETLLSLLLKSNQISLNYIDDSLKSIEKGITLSLKFDQSKYLELYKFYIYILKKEKPDFLNTLTKYNNTDRNSKIKAIYTMIQNLSFSSNVQNEKLLEIERQINLLITNNDNNIIVNQSKENILDDSDTSKSIGNDTNENSTINESQFVYSGWSESLLLIEFCKLSLKKKNFKASERTIRTISKIKQLTFTQYAKYQLLLAEFIFNLNINKYDDIFLDKAIRIRIDFLNKIIKMINFYFKLGNAPNVIQECIIKIWEYGVPLLQPQYKQQYYPFLKRCYEVLTQLNSPLYSLYSSICKELAKYNDEVSNISDAKLYINNAYKYCFDKKKIEESFEFKNIELKIKSSSMENTTFSKVEEALAMINQLNPKSKNIDNLKLSLYKILKILIPKHENHPIGSFYPLMDNKFSVNFELEDNNNVSQLKFFVEVLKLLMDFAYKIKYWELVYESASYIIWHDYSVFSEHKTFFKIISAEALIKRFEAFMNIKKDLSIKSTIIKKDRNTVEFDFNEINTNNIIYLLMNLDIIKSEFEKIYNDNEEIEFNDTNDDESYEDSSEADKFSKKKKENDKKNAKKNQTEVEDVLYINEIRFIHDVYGKQIPNFNNNIHLEKVYFKENETFASAAGFLNLENVKFINDLYYIMGIGISTNTSWYLYNATLWFIQYLLSETSIDNEFPKRYNFEKWISYIYRTYKYFMNYDKKNCELFYNISLILYQAVYERMERIIISNSSEESLNIRKKMKSNESMIKNLKGKALTDMQECLHVANEIFKSINFNKSECCFKIKLTFYEIWGKIQNIEGQSVNVNESNIELTICTLIEALRIENIQKCNFNKEKTNSMLYKLIDSAKKIDLGNTPTAVELWLLIAQSAINVNNYNVAFLAINNCFENYTCIYNDDIEIDENIKDNYQRFWIIKSLLKFNDIIAKMIENRNFYGKVTDMYTEALKYCIHALINLRYLSNLNSKLYKDIFFRIWNNILEIIKSKESYVLLQKYEEKIIEEVIIINNNKTDSKNVFIHFSKDLVPIFIKITDTLYNVSRYNKSKESCKALIEKVFRSFPTQFHRDILELRLKYYYCNENGLIPGAMHEMENDKQAELWHQFSTMESFGNKKTYVAIQNSIRLSENPIRKAEKMIRYADWMFKNEYDDKEINSVLSSASTLLGNVFEGNESNLELNEDSIVSCSVEQLELILKIYSIKMITQNSFKTLIDYIRCCNYYVLHVIKKTYNEFLNIGCIEHQPENPKKKEKKKKEKKEKKGLSSKSDDEDKINEKENEKERLKLLEAFSEKCGPLPSCEKEWLKYKWPEILCDYIFTYEGSPDILCVKSNKNVIYLIATLINIVTDSITINCLSYSAPILWLAFHLSTYWLSGIEQTKTLCMIYTLLAYFGYSFGFEEVYSENYFNTKYELTNIDFDIFDRHGYKKDPKILSVFGDVPFDIRSVYFQIANIYILLNKDMWDVRYILKNVIVNDNLDDSFKSKFYYYKAYCDYYIMQNYAQSEVVCEKSIAQKGLSIEKIRAIILKIWCIIRQHKFYKFLDGDVTSYIKKFIGNRDCKRCYDRFYYGILFLNLAQTYIRVSEELKTDELFDEIFLYLEKAEDLFEIQENILYLIYCYITHSSILLKYVEIDFKNTKESFLKSLYCINKAEIYMDELNNLFKNTLNEVIYNNNLRTKIVELKTKVYRKIYTFVDPIIKENEFLNDNIINKYLLTVDIDKKIIQEWNETHGEVFNEIMKYYKMYINQNNKSSRFLYNCAYCFRIYLKNKKPSLPAIPITTTNTPMHNRRKSISRRKSINVPLINNSIFITDTINTQILINIYREIIKMSINDQEFTILKNASEELFYLFNESNSLLKFISLSLFQSGEMQKTIRQLLEDNTPTSSPVYYTVCQLKENNRWYRRVLNKLSTKVESWKRYLILNDYIELVKNIPSNIQLIVLQHSSSGQYLLAGKFKVLPNKKTNDTDETESNECYSIFNTQCDVNYPKWQALTKSFNHELYNFENSSYVIDKIIEEIVTKRIKIDEEAENIENNNMTSETGLEGKDSQIIDNLENQENSVIRKKSIDDTEKENNYKNILPEIKENSVFPPIPNGEITNQNNNSSNNNNNNKTETNNTNTDTLNNININDEIQKKSMITFPRLLSNRDITQNEAFFNPDISSITLKELKNIDLTAEEKDEIYGKMDDLVKASIDDKDKFFKLYDILYQIFEYLYPILKEMRKIMKQNDSKPNVDTKKKKKKDKSVDNDISFDLHTVLCCDSSFFNIPIEAYIYYMLDINIVNREFSTNLLLHRLLTQVYQNNAMNDTDSNDDKKGKKDKNKKAKKQSPLENGFTQFNNFNFILNGIPNKTEPPLINIPYFKNLLKKNRILKWSGVASYMPCTKEILFYFNSPSFIYTSYTPLSTIMDKKDSNINISNTKTAIFLDYPTTVEKHKVPDINLLDHSDEFMLFLSLQGINNICFQPFCSSYDNNELIFKTTLDTAKPVDVLLYNLYLKNNISRLNLRLYGIPNFINTKNIPDIQ